MLLVYDCFTHKLSLLVIICFSRSLLTTFVCSFRLFWSWNSPKANTHIAIQINNLHQFALFIFVYFSLIINNFLAGTPTKMSFFSQCELFTTKVLFLRHELVVYYIFFTSICYILFVRA